jgi:hypothetical protein
MAHAFVDTVCVLKLSLPVLLLHQVAAMCLTCSNAVRVKYNLESVFMCTGELVQSSMKKV